MRVEVWSPDGMEAVHQAPLTTVRAAENGSAVALCTSDMGGRIWLEPEEIKWLALELAWLRTRLLLTEREAPSVSAGEAGP